MNKFKIYMDCCCFGRPFDDISQDKIRIEREAVLTIISNCEAGIWNVFQSDALTDEISRIVNPIKMQKVLILYSSATMNIELNDVIIYRASELIKSLNIGSFDALHLASAEYACADIFLTTDKKLIHRTRSLGSKIRVANPVTWLMEVIL